ITHPASAFALLPVALLTTHFTPFYDYALRHDWAHGLEHALYLGAALLFWTPVLGAEPLTHRLSGFARTAYLIASMPAMSAIGAVLVSAQHPLYPTYRRAALSDRSEEHTSELQSPCNLVCRLLLEKKKQLVTTNILGLDPAEPCLGLTPIFLVYPEHHHKITLPKTAPHSNFRNLRVQLLLISQDKA